MALKMTFGNGALGDVTEVTTTINSYANVTAVSDDSITINSTTKITGDATFSVGAKILLHVSGSADSTKLSYLGRWMLADITEVSGDVLTLNSNPTTCITSEELGNYHVQAIAVAQYQNLTLSTGTSITPPIYSASSYHGGIVAIMCSETLTFDGGHINLADRGIPPASKAIRPKVSQESDGADDINRLSGWENSMTKDRFLLNSGDGAAFIAAKTLICDEDSRIGNISKFGVQFYRGASNSVVYNSETKPSNVTNVGGSSIFIAAETIQNFNCKLISKYRASGSTAGQGLARCYIASETKLRNDEGLYAYDCLSKPSRIKQMNIKNFGNGSFGDGTALTTQLNNYATVSSIDGRKITYGSQTTAGLAQIGAGALIMLHFNQKGSTNVTDAGRFILANVLSDNGSTLTIDTDPPNISTTDYNCQIVSIPQFNNFTLGATNSATPKYTSGKGGIFAIAVKNECNLSDAVIYTATNTSSAAYGRAGLEVIGNAQDSDKLPIGQGYGSIFILANKLTMNTTTRLGSTRQGTYLVGGTTMTSENIYGGYVGKFIKISSSGTRTYTTSAGKTGSGAKGGTSDYYNGGYGSASVSKKDGYTSLKAQGAHIMIVADTITNFCLHAISTGGGNDTNNIKLGGAGYGGSSVAQPGASSTSGIYCGGYNGGSIGASSDASGNGGGGSSGWCFVYCNNVVSQNTYATNLYD